MVDIFGELMSNNPFTCIGLIFGLVIGLTISSPMEEFIGSNWLNVTNPQQTMENIFIGLPIATFLEFLITLVTTAFLTLIGLIIDAGRNIGGREY